MLKALMERRAALKASLEALNTAAVDEAGESRSFTAEENTTFDAGMTELKALDERIKEVQDAEAREDRAAAHRVETGTVNVGDGVTHEPNPVYRRDDSSVDSHSFFKDMFHAQAKGDPQARARLASAQETRAGGTTVAGAGGQFAPPLWLIEDFVKLARAGRVTADLMNKQELPSGVSSVNLPRITGGSSTAVQVLQNTPVSQTDLVTDAVTSGITTVAGQGVISLQLINQSGIPFDRVILGDLAADYARSLDKQVIAGSGAAGQLRGLLNGAGVGATTFTTVTPAVTSATAANSFYNKLVAAINTIYTTRFLAPSCVIMHPQRWSWILEAIDSTTRPLVVPNGTGFNVAATQSGVTAEGMVGNLLGLPVYLDPNIPVNLGAGLNEDRVFVCRCDDLWLYESALQTASFDATYANQNSVLYRVLGYSAFIPDRYGASVNVIAGTGLVTPVL